jgi:hypothetical protein
MVARQCTGAAGKSETGLAERKMAPLLGPSSRSLEVVGNVRKDDASRRSDGQNGMRSETENRSE